jgi:osmotically-inducible protein OsmY
MTFGTLTRGFGAVALTGALAFTAACNRNEPANDVNTTSDQGATQPSADARISTSLQAKYYADDRIHGHRIDVDTQNGVVTLRGTVPDNAAKEHAVTLARDVDGVTDVKDELQVRATESAAASRGQDQTAATGTTGRDTEERQPGWITTKVQAQYFVNPEIKPWNIDVTTSATGVVTLEGEVDSAEDKAEAVRIARETEGVTRVEDRLRIDANAGRDMAAATETEPKAGAEPTPARDTGAAGIERPDVWLTAKIQSKYFIDTDVKGRRIDVDTQNGVVTLTGAVGSEAERRHAVALARNTDGVREVKDQLRIDAALQREAGEREAPGRQGQAGTTGIDRPDAWITTKIQAQYFLDDEVKGHEINVTTNNGVVTLEGMVDTAQQKQEAELIARETEGVSRVVNQLTVGTQGR